MLKLIRYLTAPTMPWSNRSNNRKMCLICGRKYTKVGWYSLKPIQNKRADAIGSCNCQIMSKEQT